MQTNNPTPENLIQGVVSNTSVANKTEEVDDNLTQKIRVLSVKYKVYAAVILMLLALFYGSIMDSYARYQSTLSEIETTEQTILRNISKSQQYDKDISLLENIKNNLPSIVTCLNTNEGCTGFDESIMSNIAVVKSYLQLNKLESDKMDINEKIILKNINEFLAQENPFDGERTYNGNIISITIGDTVEAQEHLRSFSMNLGMSFANKDALLQFIENIENHVFYNETTGEDPLAYTALYKIESMDYDVVNYKDEQEITIALKGFYYVH